MYNRRDLADQVSDYWETQQEDQGPDAPEEAPQRFIPNWAVTLTLAGFVGLGLYLTFVGPTPSVAAAQTTETAAKIETAVFPGQQRALKRANWAPPPRRRSSEAKDDRKSRVRTGLLYSDFRQAMEDGVHSLLVDIPSGDQWAFADLRTKLEEAGSLSRFQIITEEKHESSRVFRVVAQGSPKFIGRVKVELQDGRWITTRVLAVAP